MSSLLFVHRDGPPKPRQKDEIKTIQSFIMHQYNTKAKSTSSARRKRGPAKRIKPPVVKGSGPGKHTTSPNQKCLSPPRLDGSTNPDCFCEVCMAPRASKEETKIEMLSPRSNDNLFALPMSDIGSGGGDPFSTTAVPLTPVLTSHLYHFIVHIGQHCWTAVQENGENPHVTQFLQFAFEDPACLHASATVATAHQAVLRGAFPNSTPPRDPRRIEHSLQKTAALRLVNRKLRSGGDGIKDESISAVAMLAAAEAFTGHSADLQAHLSGLKEMLRLRGGLRNVVWIVALNITITDVKCAVATQRRPSFEMLHPPDETVFSASIKSLLKSPLYSYFYSIGSRLTKGDVRTLFSPEVLATLEELRYTAIFWEICKRDSQSANSDELKQYAIRGVRVEHQLINLSHHECTDSNLTTITKACCIAGSIYSNTCLWMQAPGSAILLGLVYRLQQVLLDDEPAGSTWATILDVLLWVLFLGAHASAGQVQRQWFTKEIGRVATKLDLDSWEEVAELLIPCIYTDRVYRGPFTMIWEESQLANQSSLESSSI